MMILILCVMVGFGTLYWFYKKYAIVGLLILTVPINHFYLNLGFALKPFLIVTLVIVVAAIGKSFLKRESLFLVQLKQNLENRGILLIFVFIGSFLLSDLMNLMSVEAFRVFLLLVMVQVSYLYFYRHVSSREKIHDALKIFYFTGIFWGIIGLSFYFLFLLFPGAAEFGHSSLVHENGSFLQGVDYKIERFWEPPHLYSIEGSSAIYGATLIPFIVLSVYYAVVSKGKKFRSLAIFAFILLLSNQILTWSRTGVISSLAAILMFAILMQRFSWMKLVLYFVTAGVFIIVFQNQLMNLFYIFSEYKGFAAIRSENLDYVTANRYSFWMYGLKLFQENPFFGVGHTNFRSLAEGKLGDYKEAHNTYIEILAEHGIIVFCLYMFIFLYALIYGVKILSTLRQDDSLRIPLACLLSVLLGLLVNNFGNTSLISFMFWLIVYFIFSILNTIKLEESEHRLADALPR